METLFWNGPPVGWWIEDGRGSWMGPFETEQKAVDIAVALCPDRIKYLKLVVLGRFDMPDVCVNSVTKGKLCHGGKK